MEIEEVQDTPKLCTRMVLWELPDQYILQPIDSPSTEFLSIDRTTVDLSSISRFMTIKFVYSSILCLAFVLHAEFQWIRVVVGCSLIMRSLM